MSENNEEWFEYSPGAYISAETKRQIELQAAFSQVEQKVIELGSQRDIREFYRTYYNTGDSDEAFKVYCECEGLRKTRYILPYSKMNRQREWANAL